MKTPRLIAAGIIALGIAGAALALPATQAQAALTRALVTEFGHGPFWEGGVPSGLSVDQADGNVFIARTGYGSQPAVLVFGAGGTAPAGGLPSTLAGPSELEQFAFGYFAPADVAVDSACTIEKVGGGACTTLDPSNGYLYVDDNEAQVVDVFRADVAKTFEYVCQFNGFTEKGTKACYKDAATEDPSPEVKIGSPTGVAVDRKGDVYIASSANGTVYEYNAAGEDVRKLDVESLLSGGPQLVAVDGKGDIYVNAYQSGKLLELKRRSFTGAVESSKKISSAATGFAFDVATGRLLVDEGPVILEDNEGGEPVARFGEGVLSQGAGVGIDEASGEVYAGDQGHQVAYEFGPLVVVPSVVSGPASSVEGLAATLTGSVNPESPTLGATCHVLYGLTSSYGSTVPCAPESIAAGESEVPITASLTGLESNTTYHYRMTASNANGVNQGFDQTFTTLTEKPVISEELATPTSPNEAIFSAAVDPENDEATYRFVYGTTTVYGQSFPVAHELSLANGHTPVPVSLSVGELQPGATYHYAIEATNAGGSRTGPDQTFTMPPALAPIVVTGAAGEVEQNTATISGTVDPQGVQTTYEFDLGTDTNYGVRVFGDAGTSTEAQTFTLALRSLAPGVVYHYRMVANNIYGTTYGADQTFTTTTFPTTLLTAPSSVPLIATPAFEEPSTAGSIVPKPPANKTKTKKKKAKTTKKRHKAKKSSRARRASKAAHGHANGRSK